MFALVELVVLLMFAKSSKLFSLVNDKNSIGGVAYQSFKLLPVVY